VDLIVGLLGVLKAGGAYLPLDAQSPPERLEFMLSDAGAQVVLMQESVRGRLPGSYAGSVVSMDGAQSTQIAAQSERRPARVSGARNLAYVIYTSGSTGKPKGVLVNHENLANHMDWLQGRYKLSGTDRVIQKTTMSFDASLTELLWPLQAGGTLVLARPGGQQDPVYLVKLMREQQITVLQVVPSLLRALLAEAGLRECTKLKHVISAGEALPQLLVEELLECIPTLELHNLYGPTEASVDVSSFECERGERYESVPIGRPIANTQLYVLEGSLEVAAVGVVGELYIGGKGLARGYLGRAGLSAERFIANPYGGPGSRLYRTGDLARYRSDGNLEYLGRADHQVKIRGFRIELGEIEAALRQHEQVREAVVVARTAGSMEQSLVAYLVGSEQLSPRELREHLKRSLPEYMVPGHFVLLEQLPLTSNGKVDRRRLPVPDVLRPDMDNPYVAPVTGLEREMAAIWRDILRVERIGVYDNFFELGGHSLLAMKLVARVRNVLEYELPLRVLFETPTVAGLVAKMLQTLQVESGEFCMEDSRLLS
jgi:amino acid adenylation domain-containing protein